MRVRAATVVVGGQFAVELYEMLWRLLDVAKEVRLVGLVGVWFYCVTNGVELEGIGSAQKDAINKLLNHANKCKLVLPNDFTISKKELDEGQ